MVEKGVCGMEGQGMMLVQGFALYGPWVVIALMLVLHGVAVWLKAYVLQGQREPRADSRVCLPERAGGSVEDIYHIIRGTSSLAAIEQRLTNIEHQTERQHETLHQILERVASRSRSSRKTLREE